MTTMSDRAQLECVCTQDGGRTWRIPRGYSVQHWDGKERPILLLGSVFDASSLGKWTFDWTVYFHGRGTPLADMAGDLWLLLIELSMKLERLYEEDRRGGREVGSMIGDGERLWQRLDVLVGKCEAPMLRVMRSGGEDDAKIDVEAGGRFLEWMFGRERKLHVTEKLMSDIRIWSRKYDMKREDEWC